MSFIAGLLTGLVIISVVFFYLRWKEIKDASEDYRNNWGE